MGELPESGNHPTKEGEIMNRIRFSLALVLALTAAEAFAEGKVKRVNPARLEGMKAALADIEKGALKLRVVPPPAPPWEADYVKLVKEKCGVEFIYVDDKESSGPKRRARMD